MPRLNLSLLAWPRRGTYKYLLMATPLQTSSLDIWLSEEPWWVRHDLGGEAAQVAVGWAWLNVWLLWAVVWLCVLGALAAALVAVARLVVVLWSTFLFSLFLAPQVFASPFWFLFGLLWPASRRSSREVAPGVPAWVETDGFGQPKGSEGSLTEDGIEVRSEFRSVPVSAHLCARPRRRAVWVRRLEVVLGVAPGVVGRFVRGRWTPDLPSAEFSLGTNLILSHLEGGARILGGGSVQAKDRGSGELCSEAYLVVELADGSRDVIFPALVSSLAAYAFLRERSATRVGALRSRAVEWYKGKSLSSDLCWAGLSGSFDKAWQVSPRERRSLDRLAGGPSPPLWWSSA